MFMDMCQRDERRTKHCEHKCLNEANKQLKQHHEYTHRNAYNRHCRSGYCIDTKHDENNTSQGYGYSMSCHHICEKSNHQSQRLSKYTEELDERH